MTSVKWLTRIEAVARPFDGFQQWMPTACVSAQEDEGDPVTRMEPRALMVPPGFPDFFTRTRTVDAGPVAARGPGVVGLGLRSRGSRSAPTEAGRGPMPNST